MTERPEERGENVRENVQVHEIGNRTYIVADVEPLDVDGVRTLQVGTSLFGLAFLVLLAFHSQLSDHGRLWWMWSCLAGFGLGPIGWNYCCRRRNARRRQAGD
ncbi:MAG: DUF2530 domain-containing protein [Actinomycetota bacterium]|nr:DUF2530 domain-containing protein [Actinomycetota bacterium]